MPPKCCVPNCGRQDVKLHRMPVNRAKASLWLKVISAAVPCAARTFKVLTWAKQSKLFVCHKHFERQFVRPSMRLAVNACPTLFTSDEIASGTPAETYAEIGMNPLFS